MYARYTVTPWGQIDPQQAFRIADAIDPLMKQQQGFKSVVWLYDESAGEYGALSVWDTREDADAAGAALAPKLQELWAREGVRPQGAFAPRVYTVYEPRR